MKAFYYTACSLIFLFFNSCDPYKEPYEPPAYHAKAVVIGKEKCNADSNYNYWLLDLSIENKSSEKGDTITYNNVTYNHVFKSLNIDTVLRHPGKKAEFDFNFSTYDHQKSQSGGCSVPGAQTFPLITIMLFNQYAIK